MAKANLGVPLPLSGKRLSAIQGLDEIAEGGLPVGGL
jgi:hypothetical protein